MCSTELRNPLPEPTRSLWSQRTHPANTYDVDVSGTGTTYDYDANGNLIEKDDGTDTWTYEWDAENLLTRVLKNAAAVATFEYDPLGRRVQKVAGGTTTTFTYDGEDTIRELKGAVGTVHLHGPWTDEALAKETSGSTSYYHAEVLGSIVKLSNSSGGIIHEYRYDAFGRIELGGSQGGYSFTGREYDGETNLFYYRARYYDAESARFLSEDPIESVTEGNEYRYVRNNPVNLVDPAGESWAYWWAQALQLGLEFGELAAGEG